MRMVETARRLALLGARSAAAVPGDVVVDASRGWGVYPEEWAALAAELVQTTPAGWARVGGPELAGAPAWALALGAAAEIHPEAAAALSIVAEDERVQLPTPMAVARLLCAAGQGPLPTLLATLLPGGTLHARGLMESVEVVPGRPSSARALRLHPEVLRAWLEPAPAPQARAEAWSAFPEARVDAALAILARRGCLVLRARQARAGRQFATDLANRLGLPLSAATLTEDEPRRPRVPGSLGLVDAHTWSRERASALAGLLDAAEGLVLVSADAETGAHAAVDVPDLGPAEAHRVWSRAFPEGAEALAARFRVTLPDATAAVEEARYQHDLGARAAATHPTVGDVAERVRAQGARRMGRMVTLVPSRARLDELIVPRWLRAQLIDMIEWVRAEDVAHRRYGPGVASTLGRGLAALFSGPPGTGKTFAAHCIANELGVNLYRIDLSQVVSKYIGETEKALAQVFDEAESGHGMLLFDEADALFGKRSEVKDARDRYANIEVGYLLQRIETYSGVAILTTNLRSNLDAAFTRRLRFILEFPLPDAPSRRRLWEQALPPQPWRDPSLDVGLFADRFRLTGGHIHNIAVAATRLAAATPDGILSPAHLVRATYRELEKSGLARSAADFGPLATWMERPE